MRKSGRPANGLYFACALTLWASACASEDPVSKDESPDTEVDTKPRADAAASNDDGDDGDDDDDTDSSGRDDASTEPDDEQRDAAMGSRPRTDGGGNAGGRDAGTSSDSGRDASKPNGGGGDAGDDGDDGDDAGAPQNPDQGPAEECEPSMRGADAKALPNPSTGTPPAGPFKVVAEIDPAMPDFTIYRPEQLGMIQHPVLAWGNGGCSRNPSFFAEFLVQHAAQGILVIADGTSSTSGSSNQDGSALIKALDWAEKENARPCSKYYRKLAIMKSAVAGQSCGGLMAMNASVDKRVAASMPMNSGLFSRNQRLYSMLHAPMAIIDGGPDDIAYPNGAADFQAINTIPIMWANINVGHGGTYRQDNGGEMGKMAVAWLRWHLLDDQGATGKGMFVGDDCGFCKSSQWKIEWKMKPQ